MTRLVVDTNVLLSSFIGSGPPRLILNRIRDGRDLLCLSAQILEEYLEVLHRAGIPEDLLRPLFSLFQDSDHVILTTPTRRIALIRDDPSDNMFLECATEARADFLISGDRHLKKLRRFQDIEIVTPREYLERLRHE